MRRNIAGLTHLMRWLNPGLGLLCETRPGWRVGWAAVGLALAAGAGAAQAQAVRGPVIDMHLHASRLDTAVGIPACPGDHNPVFPGLDPKAPLDPDGLILCDHPFVSPTTADELMRQSIAELRRHNIRRAVTAGPPHKVAEWRAAAPDAIIPAASFTWGSPPPTPDELRRLHAAGTFKVLAEIGSQYAGVPADDPRYTPYWALAEELDVPVGIHLGESMPAAARLGSPKYRAALTSPFQLEEVLVRHPGLRVYVMHYGSPLVDETIAMLYSHPNLYVDVAANDWSMPRAQFHDHLRRLVEAGFGKRILFGSDQTIWPQAIGEAIEAIETAPFLSEAQKRDILYDNAARFLRLTPEEIARDHAPPEEAGASR